MRLRFWRLALTLSALPSKYHSPHSESVMTEPAATQPDNTALRVALWRALHVEADASHMSLWTRWGCNWWPLRMAGATGPT